VTAVLDAQVSPQIKPLLQLLNQAFGTPLMATFFHLPLLTGWRICGEDGVGVQRSEEKIVKRSEGAVKCKSPGFTVHYKPKRKKSQGL